MLSQLGAEGRRLYAITEVTIDLVFPIAYSLLLAAAIVRLLPESRVPWYLLPLAMGCFDLLENAAAVVLVLRFDRAGRGVYRIGSAFNMAKWVMLGATALMIVVGIVGLVLHA